MGNNIQKFEVTVRVKKKGSSHYSSRMGMYKEEGFTKMFHIDARTHWQAERRAERYGRVLHCRKVSASHIVERMANISESQPLGLMPNPYPDAVAMDDLIWRRKSKRAERIRNNAKDGE